MIGIGSLNQISNKVLIEILRLIISSDNELKIDISNNNFNLSEIINSEMFIRNIFKHKLASFFARNSYLENFDQIYKEQILKKFHQDVKDNLLKLSVIKSIDDILGEESVNRIFFKGLPLSIQTTGSIFLRGGSSDIDILIEEKNLIKVVNTLEKYGFITFKKNNPQLFNNKMGKYSRFISPEMSLYKKINNRFIFLDIHWRLSWIRDGLPSIDNKIRTKYIKLANNKSIHTLVEYDSFLLTCAHSSIDGWMCLRDLIDIQRLYQLLNKKEKIESIKFRYVRWSLLIVDNLFDSKNNEKNKIKKYTNQIFVNHAKYNQKSTWRHLNSKYWNIKDKITQLLRILFITKLFKDKLSIICELILPERNLMKNNRKYSNFLDLVILRILQLLKRIKERP